MGNEIEGKMSSQTKRWIPKDNVLSSAIFRSPCQLILAQNSRTSGFNIHGNRGVGKDGEETSITGRRFNKCIFLEVDLDNVLKSVPTELRNVRRGKELILQCG
jgi:hypothetical protein